MNPVQATQPSSPEEKLAALDYDNGSVPEGVIEEFGQSLDELADRCQAPRARIADMTLAARESLLDTYGRRDFHGAPPSIPGIGTRSSGIRCLLPSRSSSGPIRDWNPYLIRI